MRVETASDRCKETTGEITTRAFGRAWIAESIPAFTWTASGAGEQDVGAIITRVFGRTWIAESIPACTMDCQWRLGTDRWSDDNEGIWQDLDRRKHPCLHMDCE